MLKIEINKQIRCRLPRLLITKTLNLVSKIIKIKRKKNISLAIVSASVMKSLNNKYRRKNYPTDVLSFENFDGGSEIGEIIICWPIVKKQAKIQGHSTNKEFIILLIHGILHLFGYDHVRIKNAKVMEAIERKLRKELIKVN